MKFFEYLKRLSWMQKTIIVFVGSMFLLLMALSLTQNPKSGKGEKGSGKSKDSSAVISSTLNLGQAYTKLEDDNRKLNKKLKRPSIALEEIRRNLEKNRRRRSEKPASEKKLKELERKISELEQAGPTRGFKTRPKSSGSSTIPGMSKEGALPRPAEPITVVYADKGRTKDGKGAPPSFPSLFQSPNKKEAFLPPGAMAAAVLVTGVEAPTDEKTPPLPVLLSFSADGLGPSLWNTPLKGCLMIGEAAGDEVTERASVKVYRLSCVRPDGSALVREVTGWVVGEDGREGIPGVLLSKQGGKIAQTLAAEMAAGFGKALADQEYTTTRSADTGVTTRTLTGDALMAGGFTGLSETANRLAGWLLQKAEKMLPVVSVNAGRKVKVIFLHGTDLGEMRSHERNHAWAGLD